MSLLDVIISIVFLFLCAGGIIGLMYIFSSDFGDIPIIKRHCHDCTDDSDEEYPND